MLRTQATSRHLSKLRAELLLTKMATAGDCTPDHSHPTHRHSARLCISHHCAPFITMLVLGALVILIPSTVRAVFEGGIVVSSGTLLFFRCTLKTTKSHFREISVPGEKGAPHIVAAWCFKYAILKVSVNTTVLSLAEREICFIGITSADAKESPLFHGL